MSATSWGVYIQTQNNTLVVVTPIAVLAAIDFFDFVAANKPGSIHVVDGFIVFPGYKADNDSELGYSWTYCNNRGSVLTYTQALDMLAAESDLINMINSYLQCGGKDLMS